MIRRPPRSTQSRSSAASDVYKRQGRRLGPNGLDHMGGSANIDFLCPLGMCFTILSGMRKFGDDESQMHDDVLPFYSRPNVLVLPQVSPDDFRLPPVLTGKTKIASGLDIKTADLM